ncbi:MAG: 3-isopropylmalate dehydratase [Anaerolineae bacterium SM23_ 63]|nr:MAG: 3-isopropylmalate dehydratase [Anaerolineae bacterium SM23_ 63]
MNANFVIKGRVWKYSDNVNTDVIFPGKYTYTVSDPAEMPQYALADLDPNFAEQVQPFDIIVAGTNWGCGSSREQAVTCLKESGLGAIVAKSFARIYYRNCLNAALPALISPDAVDAIQDGEIIEINLQRGEIHCAAGTFTFPPLPEMVMKIFDAGGLIPYTHQRLKTQKEGQKKG